jgi:hypothetical protein
MDEQHPGRPLGRLLSLDDLDCSSREIEFPGDSTAIASKAIQIPIATQNITARPNHFLKMKYPGDLLTDEKVLIDIGPQ